VRRVNFSDNFPDVLFFGSRRHDWRSDFVAGQQDIWWQNPRTPNKVLGKKTAKTIDLKTKEPRRLGEALCNF